MLKIPKRRVSKRRLRRHVNKRRIVTLGRRFVGKTKSKIIRVSHGDTTREVEAHVVGPIAVHQEASPNHPRSGAKLFPSGAPRRKGWIVTHVRTGASLIGLSAHATFRQAMQIARELVGRDINWLFGEFGKRPEMTPQIKRAHRAYLAAGIRAGLSLRTDRD